MVGNSRGIITHHYSQPADFFVGLFHRYRWETVRVFGTTFHANLYSSMSVHSDTMYSPLYLPTYTAYASKGLVRICEITFVLDACVFTDMFEWRNVTA